MDNLFSWVVVDWRGFYGSNGADVSSVDRGEDGYDMCEWIAAQPWHLDRIGTWGPSALGGVQYQTAKENHPNHVCAVPIVATGSQFYETYFYGGVLEQSQLESLDILGYGISTVVYANPYHNALWQFTESTTWFPSFIQIPTLQIGGWYDHNIDEMMDFYEDSRNLAAANVQDKQWLLVGPWVHGGTGIAKVGTSVQGELMYPNAALKNDSMAWDFLEYHLLDLANGWESTSKITYYELGNDVWRTSDADNIAAPGSDILYLNGSNELTAMLGTDKSTFISDPTDPSPTIGGATLSNGLDQGPYDQSTLDTRADILTFSTGILDQDVSISGRIYGDLYVSSDQPDCDIAIRLVDHYPDGRSMLITDGIKRMRFRNGYTVADEVFMNPGEVYNVQVYLPFTNYTWLAGHELKIYVSGNHSTRFAINIQNGDSMYVAGDTNIANISIHHDATYPSKLVLPGDNPSLTIKEYQFTPEIQIELFPNPVGDDLHIRSELNFTSYIVFDITGRVISSGDIRNDVIRVEKFGGGLYLLELRNSDGVRFVQKFVKE